MNPNPEIAPKLDELLHELRRSTARDPQLAARARDAFLAEAAKIAPQAPRVSFSAPERLNRWKEIINTLRFGMQKEQKPMFNLVMTALLVLGALFGSGATTVAAAQAAQPDETLYPLKTWTEDVRMDWESDPQARLDLALQFSARRTQEIQAMLAADSAIPELVVTRFENQQQQALDLAAGMSDELTISALEQVRDQVRQQEQAMAQLHVQNQAAQQVHTRIQTMLQNQEQMAQQGIQNPGWLRQQLRQRGQGRNGLFSPTAGVTESGQTALPGNNSWKTGTPTSGSGYGPGADGSQNPMTTGTPAPGSG